MLESCQLLEILVDIGIKIVKSVSVIAGFGAEKDHQNPLNATEWEENPETVFPPKIGCDGSSDDRNQAGNSAEDEIEERDSNTTFVYEIHITNDCYDNRFESASGEPLNNSADK